MIPALAAAFGASLLGSPHCVGMCGAFSSVHSTRTRGAAWHLGRGAAYVTGGAIAGGVGGFAAELGWVGIGLMAAMLVWFAARLAGFTAEVDLEFDPPWDPSDMDEDARARLRGG